MSDYGGGRGRQVLDDPRRRVFQDPISGSAFGRRAQLVALAVFSGLVLVNTRWHEPWRDELQAWSIARASGSLPDLLSNLRYEGHPFLWHLVLWPFARITGDPVAMQFVSVLVAVGAAWLILSRAPFVWWVRIMLVFSYFPAYEYSVLARSYGLGMFLAIASCVVLTSSRRDGLLPPILFALLALTSLYGLIISGALVFAWLLEAWLRRVRMVSRVRVAGLGIYAMSVVLAARFIIPPSDAPFGVSLGNGHIARSTSLSNIWRAMVPVPSRLDAKWWETNLIDRIPKSSALAVVGGLLIVLAVAVRARRSPAAVLLWFSGLTVLEAFTVLRYPGGLRHAGTVVVLAIVTLWLAPRWEQRWPVPPALRRGGGRERDRERLRIAERVAGLVVFACLGASVLSTGAATVADGRAVFSPARSIANEIRRAGLSHAFIVGYPDLGSSAVAAELDRPIWYLNSDRLGTFIRWDARRRDRLDDPVGAIEKLRAGVTGAMVIITSEPLTDLPRSRLLSAHQDTTNEPMWVYVLDG